jgi:hypothetical protein
MPDVGMNYRTSCYCKTIVKSRTGVFKACSCGPRNGIVTKSKPTQKNIRICANPIWRESKRCKGIINWTAVKSVILEKLTVPRPYNSQVHHRVQKSPTHIHILNRMNLVYANPSSCFKMLFNTILSSKPRSAKCSLSFVFRHPLLHTHKLLNLIKIRCSYNGDYEDVNLLWYEAACPEDGSSRYDLNVGKYLPDYTAAHTTGQ